MEETQDVLATKLFAHELTLKRARTLVNEAKISIPRLSECIARDPVTSMELMCAANAALTKAKRQLMKSVQAAVVHLGMQKILELIDMLEARPRSSIPEVNSTFEMLRLQGRRMAEIGVAISDTLRTGVTTDVETASLFANVGHMVACVHFNREYVKLLKDGSRANLVYKLATQKHFDVQIVRLAYIREYFLPESVVVAFDRDSYTKSHLQSVVRISVDAAAELVYAYDDDKWSKYEPTKSLPANSALRLLQLSEVNHHILFERCTQVFDFFKNAQSNEELLYQGPQPATAERAEEHVA